MCHPLLLKNIWEWGNITSKVRKAVIPAAGAGTRFFPLTRTQPKEMLPILDKPVIQYVVEEALLSGLDEILIIVGYGKDSIIDYFDRHPLDSQMKGFEIDMFPEIYFVRQREQKGLGDSLRYAEKFTGDDPFLVLLGDTIYKTKGSETTSSEVLKAYGETGKLMVLVEKVEREKIQDYGIISGKKISKSLWSIDDLVEKPDPGNAPTDMGITGTYLLNGEIYDILRELKPGKNNEYQLTDALRILAANGMLLGYEINGTRYDIGTKELWVKTFIDFAREDPRFKRLF